MKLESEFDATAEHYDVMVGLNPGYHEHLRTAAQSLADRLPNGDAPARVADLGCGSGASTVALVDALGPAAADAEILSVDASDGMLAVARRKSWPAGVRFQHGMATRPLAARRPGLLPVP